MAFVLLLTACAGPPRAPIEQKVSTPERIPDIAAAGRTPVTRPTGPPPVAHVVRKGDTLHAIAWRYRLDYRDLVRWNGIRNPDLIFVGQKLRLKPPAVARAGPGATRPQPARRADAKPAPSAPAKPVREQALTWTWPANGKVSPAVTVSGSKGIEIRGRKGQDVKAAGAGSVVYSGSGLRGYGELIIIKHNETFLSAYAHNDARLVSEGRRVEVGETIARMGDTEARDVMLHFEIRRNGEAVDPLKYLPRQ